MAGRRPKPTALRVIEGNAGKRPLPENEPKPARVLPAPPKHLRPRALAAWRYVAEVLDRMGVLTEADGLALERLCECYADIQEARARLAQPIVVPDAQGKPVELAAGGEVTYVTRGKEGWMVRTRPEVAVIADADRRFKSYLVEFGLTPAARAKVQTAGGGAAGDDPVESYFGG